MTEDIITDRELCLIGDRRIETKQDWIDFGTVRQYCEFFDIAPKLASYNNDMKDLQRCWMLRQITRTVPPGAQLLEIGAGEPLIAHLLTRLGYKVIVVDPYEGYGNGPQGIGDFKLRYPGVDIVQSEFSEETTLIKDVKIDCFYSISVMEHVSFEKIHQMYKTMSVFGSLSYTVIHAVDYVTAGTGSEYHKSLIYLLSDQHGLPRSYVLEVLENVTLSNETYYLSAEAHNRWRGSMSYDDFPMRKCVSIHFSQSFKR